MDPVTIAAAAVALAGTNAVAGFATQAGAQAWEELQKALVMIRTRLSPRGRRALASIEAGQHQPSDIEAASEEIARLAESDVSFREALTALLELAGQSKPVAAVIAVARDNARQVNIGGDYSGTINLG